METVIIRSSFMGYNEKEVLYRIDKLNFIVKETESGKIAPAAAAVMAEQITSAEIKTSFFGFNKQDTDRYISELINRIGRTVI